ncbi:3'(2'),5'-bisphosphate nucleotidase CysQ [Oceanimonas sp. CHS3-5]|uniref:3'(2'),5'-bisphosphate nucleotidase CysQ n=1 Tax=Oceanimonas sp. CHS3-5 TaxID=3068186 RepID=UPI00273E883C|nr:3'(2'),5'-bisphosphate nucleotidase CysQ [Oceanimonas sp. CHS3-5]MDP5292257.1 3'(2'),5'-bisphosphate nucleotidase CysQ [Oceanimonas sp. CHS3-5]
MSITQELLNQVDALARRAGDAIMEIYGRDFAVEHKQDNSPLTEADAAAHHIIADGLARLELKAPVLSEEDTAGFAGADEHGRYWLVDPLDGTKEFIKRNGEFTVNIALIENGKPVLGVVYAPALNTGYVAAEGLGAFKTEGDAAPVAISVAEHQTGTPWRVVGSRSHGGGELPALLEKLGEHQLVPMGSSLKLCLVAENAADIYPRLGPTSLWDTGAAQCVVEQAGGTVVQLSGEPLSYANTREVLNPYFLVLGENDVNWPALFA